jgi:2'-5' RNA ligase
MIYVLAYPKFEPSVEEHITRFRVTHEPERAELVPPHITLVFGLRDVQPLEFITFCEKVAERVPAVAVDFSATEIIQDTFEMTHKLLLLISNGKNTLIALHEHLYDGPHRSEKHSATPYRPHMTIATNTDRTKLERLNGAEIGAYPISGMVHALEVVEFVEKELRSLRTIPLQR